MSASSSAASSTLSRTRGAILLLSTCVFAYGIYYLRGLQFSEASDTTNSSGLHRSNAIYRRQRRSSVTQNPEESRRPDTPLPTTPLPVDEDADIVATNLNDGETVVDQDEFDSPGNAPLSDLQRGGGQNIIQLLFRVSEDATRRNAYVHRGCGCNGCGVVPIRGIRYRCANCADFDLCEGCESQGQHIKTHIFYKIRIPAPSFGPRQIQPVWYTGHPETPGLGTPSKDMIARLSRETGFERTELEAYWEQWTFMACTLWNDDPDETYLAMDRPTFERCLVPSGGYRITSPSLIFDRMFSFYDTNNDDLIGFSEFLHGLAYRKTKDKWRKIFKGYDIDNDGYVDRKDFLRMFRSYYVLYRQMHRDMLEGLDDQQMMSPEAHKLVASRQPLSSAFGHEGRYPSAPGPRNGEGKSVRNGDLEVNDGKGVLRESSRDTGNREDVLRYSLGRHPPPRDRESDFVRTSMSFWRSLVSPPESISDMSELVEGISRERLDEASRLSESSRTNEHLGQPSDDDADDVENNEVLWFDRQQELNMTDEDANATEPGATLASLDKSLRSWAIAHARERHQTQHLLHERWKRRQFYTDEEEGATPPAGWNEEDDVLARENGAVGENSKFQSSHRPSIHSRSSSKVRFAEDMDDFDTRSNPSTSSRSVPERWGGIEIPDAEKDAGKEILYQITQQAFNELLDPLFKEKEDLAVEAASTKEERDKYRHLFTSHKFVTWAVRQYEEEKAHNEIMRTYKSHAKEGEKRRVPQTTRRPEMSEVEIEDIRLRPVEDLLSYTGYTVEEPDDIDAVQENLDVPDSAPSPPTLDREVVGDAVRSIVDSAAEPNLEFQEYARNNIFTSRVTPLVSNDAVASPQPTSPLNVSPVLEARDPTLPQFRPNSDADSKLNATETSKSTKDGKKDGKQLRQETAKVASNEEEKRPKRPSQKRLYQLWKLEQTVLEGESRGGLGRLSFEEFQKIVKEQRGEGKGNAMDYLGSWIEFCIP